MTELRIANSDLDGWLIFHGDRLSARRTRFGEAVDFGNNIPGIQPVATMSDSFFANAFYGSADLTLTHSVLAGDNPRVDVDGILRVANNQFHHESSWALSWPLVKAYGHQSRITGNTFTSWSSVDSAVQVWTGTMGVVIADNDMRSLPTTSSAIVDDGTATVLSGNLT